MKQTCQHLYNINHVIEWKVSRQHTYIIVNIAIKVVLRGNPAVIQDQRR